MAVFPSRDSRGIISMDTARGPFAARQNLSRCARAIAGLMACLRAPVLFRSTKQTARLRSPADAPARDRSRRRAGKIRRSDEMVAHRQHADAGRISRDRDGAAECIVIRSETRSWGNQL